MADDIVSQYYLANALRQGQRQSPRSMLAQRMMQNALDTSPTTPLGALARALTGVVSAYTLRQAEEGDRLDQKQALSALMDRDQQQQDEATQWLRGMQQGGQPPAAGAAPAPAPVTREALPAIGGPAPQGVPAGAFSPVAMRSLVGQESGGDPNARPIDRQTGQPRSSALGQAQFIAPTWLAFAGANPNLFQGLDLNTPAGRNAALARRSDPTLTEPAVQWYAGQNAQALQQAGLPVTDASLAAAHALGPAGAIGVLRAAPDTPLSRVLSPAAIQANPQYGRMTAGQFVSDYGARYAPRASVVQFAGPGAPTEPAAPGGTVDASPPGSVQATLDALRQQQGAPAAAGGGALPPSAAAAAPPMASMPSAPAAPTIDMAALQEGLASNNPRVRRAAEAARDALLVQQQAARERRAEAAVLRQEDAASRAEARQELRDRLAEEAARRAEVRANQGPIPQGMRMNPQTQQLEPIPGFTPPSSQPTEQERISAGYASRMMAAEQTLSRVVQGGFNPGNWTDATMGRLPIVGNALTSEGGQLYRQAQEDWVRAKLRRESGAVIGAEEMAQEVRTYFPQPGDTPAMIAQKEQARRLASQAMVGAAGRGTIINPPETPAAPPAGAVTHRFNPQTGQVEAVR